MRFLPKAPWSFLERRKAENRRDRNHQRGHSGWVMSVSVMEHKGNKRDMGKKTQTIINISGPALLLTAVTGVYQELPQTLEISLRSPQCLDTYGIMILLILSCVKILQASAALKSCL